MARPKRSPTEQGTRERIVSAAIDAFAARGQQATLADIGAAVGITRPSLLHHFASKEAVMAAVLGAVFAQFQAIVADATTHGGNAHRLAERFVDLVRGQPAMARLLLRELSGDGHAHDALVALTEPLLIQAASLLAPSRPIAEMRVAMMQGIVATLSHTASPVTVRTLWGDDNDVARLVPVLFARALIPAVELA
jgi:AcrR family transcriptional regulator